MTLHRSSWYQSSKASLYSFHTFPTISPSVQLVPFFTHSPPSFPFPFYSCSLPLPFSPNLLLPCGAEFVDLAGVILGREFRNQMCQSYGRINAYHSPRLLLLFLLLSFPPSTPAPFLLIITIVITYEWRELKKMGCLSNPRFLPTHSRGNFYYR